VTIKDKSVQDFSIGFFDKTSTDREKISRRKRRKTMEKGVMRTLLWDLIIEKLDMEWNIFWIHSEE
jgi:hypothetical protein